jgi:hypothetical protein
MDLVSFDTPGEHKLFTAIARQGQPCFHGIFLDYFFSQKIIGLNSEKVINLDLIIMAIKCQSN